ncbi:hypothetical protein ABWH96_06045 [Marivirga tractuosa]|uniref:hypothetical protein n=1 Tax=Marivirga tractuosa TaxID=1006 RepID=UPI0035D0987A
MDRIIIFNNVSYSFEDALKDIKVANPEYDFTFYKEIPEDLIHSYYLNEQLINPKLSSFEKFQKNLEIRSKSGAVFSVASLDGEIVSSLSGMFNDLHKEINLWYTNESHRGKSLGLGVLYNLIINIKDKHSYLEAIDVTNKRIDELLLNCGFNEK